MENQTATTKPVGVTSSRTDQRAWIENQVLSHQMDEAQRKLDLAVETSAPPSRLRRLESNVQRAREAIYLANRALARSVANKYTRSARPADCDDLYQVADEALWRAIQTWDPQGSPLGSWAHQRIAKACRVFVARNEHGLSIWSWEKRPAVLSAARQLESDRLPVTPEVVADIADVTVELATLILDRHYNGAPLSLDAPVGETGTPLASVLDIEVSAPTLEGADSHDQLVDLVADIPISDLVSWVRTTGIDGASAWTADAVAQVLATSGETVRRASARAEKRIKEGPRVQQESLTFA